jgi:RNA polymerase sigma factor (sigma-70 family)
LLRCLAELLAKNRIRICQSEPRRRSHWTPVSEKNAGLERGTKITGKVLSVPRASRINFCVRKDRAMETENPTPPDYTHKTSYKLFAVYRQDPSNPKGREAIAEHYGKWVYPWALKMVKDRDVAEEIVQEFFLKLFENLGSLELKEGSLRPWVGTVVMHIVFNWNRVTQLRPLSEDQLALLGSQESCAFLEEQIDLADAAADCRDRFPAAEQKLLRDSRFDQRTYDIFLRILRDGISPADVERELGIKTPGYASKCKERVVRWLLEELGLPDDERSRAILVWVMRGYGNTSEL